jgi:hypothetical protein
MLAQMVRSTSEEMLASMVRVLPARIASRDVASRRCSLASYVSRAGFASTPASRMRSRALTMAIAVQGGAQMVPTVTYA